MTYLKDKDKGGLIGYIPQCLLTVFHVSPCEAFCSLALSELSVKHTLQQLVRHFALAYLNDLTLPVVRYVFTLELSEVCKMKCFSLGHNASDLWSWTSLHQQDTTGQHSLTWSRVRMLTSSSTDAHKIVLCKKLLRLLETHSEFLIFLGETPPPKHSTPFPLSIIKKEEEKRA